MKKSTALKVLGATLLLLILAGSAAVFARLDATAKCSSTAIRFWAGGGYAERVMAGSTTAWPTVPRGSTSAPIVTRTEDTLTVNWPGDDRESEIDWRHHERVEAGPSMKASLPHVPGAALELTYWRIGNGPWLDPRDGTESVPQPSWTLDHDSTDEVVFILRPSGTEGQFHGVTLFDRDTRVQLNNGSSWTLTGRDDDEMRLAASVQMMHRASLLLEVPLTYGPPVVEEIRLVEGASASFGIDATASFLGRGLGHIRSRGSGIKLGGRQMTLRWDPPRGNAQGWAALAFSPVGLAAKFQGMNPTTGAWTGIHPGNLMPLLQGITESTESIQLRYLPHAARIQFKLPRPMSAPVVRDLLQCRPRTNRYEDRFALGRLLQHGLQIKPSSMNELHLDRLTYPVTLSRETLGELLEVIRAETGSVAFLDTYRFEFRSEPWSLLERLQLLGNELVSRLRP